MNFESNEFSIPDFTESEIAKFFNDEGETEALASPVDLPPGYRNSKAEDKVASLSRYGLRLSEPQLERLRINGIPEKTCVQTEWNVRVWKDLPRRNSS